MGFTDSFGFWTTLVANDLLEHKTHIFVKICILIGLFVHAPHIISRRDLYEIEA